MFVFAIAAMSGAVVLQLLFLMIWQVIQPIVSLTDGREK